MFQSGAEADSVKSSKGGLFKRKKPKKKPTKQQQQGNVPASDVGPSGLMGASMLMVRAVPANSMAYIMDLCACVCVRMTDETKIL